MLQAFVILFIATLGTGCAHARDLPSDTLFREGTAEVSLREALQAVQPGQTVVLGEIHGRSEIADQHMQVMETLREFGHSVSVGLEFFYYPDQPQVEAWRRGDLEEEEFLRQINWGQGISFDHYRSQALFPEPGREFALALNAPRALTSQISKVGVEGLNSEERALLPPQFTLGNERYFERFKKTMEGHVPSEEALKRYFAAQSAWDDTMAWRAAEFLQAHPDQVLVIIVGEFHVQYGGGLPDRLRARGVEALTFSQVNLEGLSESEQREVVEPSEQDGARADYVWTLQFE